jgi:hypothetical protein
LVHGHHIYVWNGRNAEAIVKATALTKGFQLEQRFLADYAGTAARLGGTEGRAVVAIRGGPKAGKEMHLASILTSLERSLQTVSVSAVSAAAAKSVPALPALPSLSSSALASPRKSARDDETADPHHAQSKRQKTPREDGAEGASHLAAASSSSSAKAEADVQARPQADAGGAPAPAPAANDDAMAMAAKPTNSAAGVPSLALKMPAIVPPPLKLKPAAGGSAAGPVVVPGSDGAAAADDDVVISSEDNESDDSDAVSTASSDSASTHSAGTADNVTTTASTSSKISAVSSDNNADSGAADDDRQRRRPVFSVQKEPDFEKDESGLARSEKEMKRAKIAFYDVLCSQIVPGLCVSSNTVVQDEDLLRREGITHVINCAGTISPSSFEGSGRIKYLTLMLDDVGGEDISSIFHIAFRFIDDALGPDGPGSA